MILVRGDGCELEEVQGSQGQGGREPVCESHPCLTRKSCDPQPPLPQTLLAKLFLDLPWFLLLALFYVKAFRAMSCWHPGLFMMGHLLWGYISSQGLKAQGLSL